MKTPLLILAACFFSVVALIFAVSSRDASSETNPGVYNVSQGSASQGLRLSVSGPAHDGRIGVGKRSVITLRATGVSAGQRLIIELLRRGDVVKREERVWRGAPIKVYSKPIVSSGDRSWRAALKPTPGDPPEWVRSDRFSVRYPELHRGDRGREVSIAQDLMRSQGYRNAPSGSKFNSSTERAVIALAKVNRKEPTGVITKTLYKRLANKKAGFKLAHPGAGRHVEADLSRQVLVLAKGGRAIRTYTTSSGKSSTPTVLGKFWFYRKEPGTNSLGMVDSVYFYGGYATHGYYSVPNYPASHGCLRTPIPDAPYIYNWINLGDPIFVYYS